MKMTKFVVLFVCGLMLSSVGVGCRKKPSYLTPLPGQRTQAPGDLTPGDPIGTGGTSGQDVSSTSTGEFGGTPLNPAGTHDGWIENAAALKAQTVYFDFDSSAIKASEQANVAAVADYLKANTAAAVRVEGHCDERGTEGYNEALGSRRALAVREDLIRLGIESGRVDTITYGEQRPAVQGYDESAYRLNRRAEFIVLTPP